MRSRAGVGVRVLGKVLRVSAREGVRETGLRGACDAVGRIGVCAVLRLRVDVASWSGLDWTGAVLEVGLYSGLLAAALNALSPRLMLPPRYVLIG